RDFLGGLLLPQGVQAASWCGRYGQYTTVSASLADYFTCDCPPSRQLGLAFFWSLQGTNLPYLGLSSKIQRHLRPPYSIQYRHIEQEKKNKRKAGVRQQLQHLQSQPTHRIFSPHPVLPQVNYCRQPTDHSFRRPQTAGAVQIEALPHRVRLTPRTCHHHPPRAAQRQPPPSPQLLLLLLLLLPLFPLSFYGYTIAASSCFTSTQPPFARNIQRSTQ
ncbi:hypothetical protein BDP55DRAFT_744308, partial [Colletotrichum godetiae]